jgi:hypothetical protein
MVRFGLLSVCRGALVLSLSPHPLSSPHVLASLSVFFCSSLLSFFPNLSFRFLFHLPFSPILTTFHPFRRRNHISDCCPYTAEIYHYAQQWHRVCTNAPLLPPPSILTDHQSSGRTRDRPSKRSLLSNCTSPSRLPSHISFPRSGFAYDPSLIKEAMLQVRELVSPFKDLYCPGCSLGMWTFQAFGFFAGGPLLGSRFVRVPMGGYFLSSFVGLVSLLPCRRCFSLRCFVSVFPFPARLLA